MIRRSAPSFFLFLVLVTALLAHPDAHASRAAVVVSEDPATSRAPLAMLAGDVPWPDQDPWTGTRANAALLPRVPPDEFLASLMDSVKVENITGTIQRLQDFYTRYVVSDSCWSSAAWIANELETSGYTDVVYDTFRCWSYQDTVDAANVIAVKPGATRPDEYVVIGGHYDSITTDNFHTPDSYAPGADDNATGVAGVLEAARILAPLELERSVIFALWSGEEVGLRGSRAWVADAVETDMDIVIYLNMDVIGYTDEDPPVAIIYSDTTSLAAAGLMKNLIVDHTPYGCRTVVRPVGASDQNSFSERGINILDTSSGAGWSPYHHTPNDIIDNVDLELCRALAAVNVAATAALAIVVGEDENLPPETVLVDNCAAQHDSLGREPRFEWIGVDFDGQVARYEYRVTPRGRVRSDPGAAGRVWQELPPDSLAITLAELDEGQHAFEVRAIDDDGLPDPTPALHVFTVDDALAPRLEVTPRFGAATHVFENERLVFGLSASAEHYCSELDGVSWAVGSGGWSEWTTAEAGVTIEAAIRPTLGDTLVTFRARDEYGSMTSSAVAFEVVAAPMNEPLLHLDDWLALEMPEFEHDTIYDSLLADLPHDTWDPYEHIQGEAAQLPTMEEMGRYRTILWTLSETATLLRPAQAESGYHAIEGFVRAGGNLIVEGYATLSTLAALDEPFQDDTYGPGDFIHDYAGIDSMHNTGSATDPQVPDAYGYAFLGGLSTDPGSYPDVPVDTLGTWSEGFAQHGGLRSCEIYSTVGAQRLHLFDAYLNESLDEKPCATLRRSDVGCGSVAVLGYPLCYAQPEPGRNFVLSLVDNITTWQEPAELASFQWDAQRDYVFFVWYLYPVDGPQWAMLERRVVGSGTYELLGTEVMTPEADGRYRLFDGTVEPGATYDYRLVVKEAWGGLTRHGPWTIEIPTELSLDRLEAPRPNPMTNHATISYTVANEHRWVRINVYSAGGRLVKRLHDGPARRGRHETTWDGRDADGHEVASGVYFVRADFGSHALERKLVLLR